MTSQKGITPFCTIGVGAAFVALGSGSHAFVTLPATADAAPSLQTRNSANQYIEKQRANASLRLSGALVLGAAAACAVTLAARRRAAVGRARDLDSPRGARVVVAARGEMGSAQFIGYYLVSKLREFGHKLVILNRGKTSEGKPDRLPHTSVADYEKMLEGVTVLKADREAEVAAAGKFDIDNNVRTLILERKMAKQ